MAGGEVQDGHPEYAVEGAVRIIDGGFELLPEDLLILRGNFRLGRLLRAKEAWRACADGDEQGEAEKSFQHGDLRVGGIIRPKRTPNERRKTRPCSSALTTSLTRVATEYAFRLRGVPRVKRIAFGHGKDKPVRTMIGRGPPLPVESRSGKVWTMG